MTFRRIVSLTLFWSFAAMVLTGIMLFIVPQGRVAYWSNWRLWGLDKTQWGDLHIACGALMLVCGLFHIYFNWRTIMVYLKTKARRMRVFTPEFNVALAVIVLVLGLTLAQAPPFVWLLEWNASIKDAAALVHGDPPYGHAEESTLSILLSRLDLDETAALKALETAGIAYDGPDWTVLEIADANGLSPSELFAIIQPEPKRRETDSRARPGQVEAGYGRRTLTALAAEFGVETSLLVGILDEMGIKATESSRLRTLADRSGLSPHDIYARLQSALSERRDRAAD